MVTWLVPVTQLLLVPVSRLSVSVRRWWASARSIPVGPTGLLAPRLLLGPTLDSLVSLSRTDCTLTMVVVNSTLVVLPGSISFVPV